MSSTDHGSGTDIPELPLDPLLDKALRVSRAAGRRSVAVLTTDQARAQMPLPPDAPEDPRLLVEDSVLALESCGLPLRRYTLTGRSLGTVIYLHGGGWVLGSIAHADPTCRRLALDSSCDVLSVEYPLAPESPFPAALTATTELLINQIQRSDCPVVVMGESAGANLVLGALQSMGATERSSFAGAVLVTPLVDLGRRRPSHARHDDPLLLLSTPDLAWYVERYLPADADRADPRVSPLRGDLRHLPRTCVVIAGHDPLRDEASELAELLRAHDDETRVITAPTLGHAFLSMHAVVEAAAKVLDQITTTTRVFLESASPARQ
ncbi:alpha/beta hydrolase [Georgenia sp. Z1491]|uniref:alpha/beta hydrolase n=1 Tax=Georgenia sp. Z1491 TaxID=3416707 RepID=UPI003CED8B76